MNPYLPNPRKLQFELSSMCNALCLGCVRTDSTSFNEKKYVIPEKQYISFDVFKKILLSPSFSSIEELEFCGTIDDPLMHPEFLEFLDWASTVGRYNVLIHTNASLRNTKYWQRMAEILQKHDRHVVKFSIDGMEDTNHIYRQNTIWSKIMENARAFIAAGGNAGWQYLIFPWNEHQIMEAKQLSVEMGFNEFMSRHDRSVATSLGLEKIQKIKVDDIKRRSSYTDLTSINNRLADSVHNEIQCNNQTKKMYFIGFDSRLWPCCFLHNGLINLDQGKVDALKKRLYDAYGDDSWNDLTKHTVEEILQHEFYQNDLVASWSDYEHDITKTSRIYRCTEVCNVKKLEVLPIGNYKIL